MKANLEYSSPVWPDRVNQRSKSILQLPYIGAPGIYQGEKVSKERGAGQGEKRKRAKINM